jgi:hypothetical protein
MSTVATMNNERVKVRVFNKKKTFGMEFWASDFPFDRGIKTQRNWVSFHLTKIKLADFSLRMIDKHDYYSDLEFAQRRTARQIVDATRALFDAEKELAA